MDARQLKRLIRFEVKFEDGSVSHIQISSWDLQNGDHVARIIAREHQDRGELRPGNIVSVRRVR
jgi:hypothetical protein